MVREAQPHILFDINLLKGIREQALSRPRKGIYFLFRGDVVVYIGQSIHIDSRIDKHIKDSSKDFDSFSIIEIDTDIYDLDECEAAAIYTYDPIYNTRMPKNNTYITEKDALLIFRAAANKMLSRKRRNFVIAKHGLPIRRFYIKDTIINIAHDEWGVW